MTFRRPLRGDGRVLLGVCAGLARRWDLEPRTIRFALVVTLLPLGAGLLVYAALALVMPGDGASDAEAGWRGEIGRSIKEALVVLAAALGVVALAGASAGLALFGLAGVALLLATAALTGLVVADHARAWLLGGLALALAAPAAVVELTDVSVVRQVSDVRVSITRPQDVREGGYRAGLGALLLDLRDFDAEERTTTTIRARADLGGFVVALPRDRCFNLEVEYAYDRTWVERAVRAAGRPAIVLPSAPGHPPIRGEWDTSTAESGALVAFGRAYPGASGRYRRPVADPAAPTIRLRLESGRSQIRVRDYPLSIDPLVEQEWPRFAPPSLEQILRKVTVGVDGKGWYTRGTVQSARSVGKRAPGAASRGAGAAIEIDPKSGQVSASGRTAIGEFNETLRALGRRDSYPAREARRLAGPCAAQAEVDAIRGRFKRMLDQETRTVVEQSPKPAVVRSLLAFQETMAELSRTLERGGPTTKAATR